MSAFVIPSIFTAVDKFSSPLKGMGRNLQVFADKADSTIARNERLFRKLTPAISETSKQFMSFASSAAIATAVVGGAAFSAKSIMDYEAELANLQAVTGASGKDFDIFKGKIKDVANETKTSAVDVAQAFTAIANNQPELLKDADALATVTKNSILLAKASKMELQPAGEALTQILNQYGKGAKEAAKTVDILAAGSVAGSSEIRDTADAIQKFGTVAASAGIKIDESVALIELASKFEKGSEAGSKLRNILITMSTAKVQDPKAVSDMKRLGVNMDIVADKARPLNERLLEMAKVSKDDAALFHIFGKENQALATGVLTNAAAFAQMQQQVNTSGMAAKMAEKNNATLAISIKQLKDKFVTWLVTSDEAATALNVLKRGAIFLANNLTTIIKIVGVVVGAFLAWKIAIYASQIAMVAYNIVLGINAALTGQSAFVTMGSTVAYGAFRAAVVLGTAAQWALNVALAANPVALVVIAVLALVAALGYVIANYKTIEQLHSTELQKKKTAAIADETKQINIAAAAYEKYGYSKADAQKKALQDSKQFILDDLTRQKEAFAKPMDEKQRRIAENQMAINEGRLTAVNQAEAAIGGQPAQGSPLINPKVAQSDALSKTINTNIKEAISIDFKNVPKGVDITGTGNSLDSVMGKTTSTMGN